jgi:hypothetical protein
MMRARRLLTTGLVTLGVLAGGGLVTGASAFAAKPVVNPGSVLGVTPSTASVYAFVGPEELVSSCVVEYGKTTGYGSSVPCEPATLEGAEEQFTTGSLTGLEPGTAYHYRFAATNVTGETKDADGELTTVTLAPPIIDGESAAGLSSGDATLEAQVNPNYQETTYAFEYATNEALTGATTIGAGVLPAEFGDQSASVDIGGGLLARTKYYYRVVATNNAGTTPGKVESFTTLAPPLVTAGEAQDVTSTTATLTGALSPAGADTAYHFAYVDQAGYESALEASSANPYIDGAITPGIDVGAGYGTRAVGPVTIRELLPGETYHYALVARNSQGTAISAPDATFTTSGATPPLAVTGDAVGVGRLSATLTGSVDIHGLSTTLQFEFGTSPSLGSVMLASIVPDAESEATVGIEASFGSYLQSGETYYYRAVASNADGISQGATKSFTTSSFPGFPTIAAVPVIALPVAPAPTKPTTAVPKKLTNAQKLTAALKACAKKPKGKRAGCQKQARKRFAPAKKKSKKTE